MANSTDNQAQSAPTAVLALSDGALLFGRGCGAIGSAAGEVCFNTAMTGHQEIASDPSYAEQILCFTFPHVGNTGANLIDDQDSAPQAARAARGVVLAADVTLPSNHRASHRSGPNFDAWLAARGIIGLAGVDTRALTRRIRTLGMPQAVIAHDPEGRFDLPALVAQARAWAGLEGRDLAVEVTAGQTYAFAEGAWDGQNGLAAAPADGPHIVVVDYGVKRDILRQLVDAGARVSVVRAQASAEEVLALAPDGVVLSNGPGDPAATASAYAGAAIKGLIDAGTPILAICLGHQMLARALGAKTVKMAQGHHGANHPVQDLDTGRVEIVSMNHGFAVEAASLPAGVRQTHVSLFDGTNCGLAVAGKPILSVQHHPEAAPGPQDAFGVFDQFMDLVRAP